MEGGEAAVVLGLDEGDPFGGDAGLNGKLRITRNGVYGSIDKPLSILDVVSGCQLQQVATRYLLHLAVD